MTIHIKIECRNAAFDPYPHEEAARILREAAGRIEQGDDDFRLRDHNGNTVGSVNTYEDEPTPY